MPLDTFICGTCQGAFNDINVFMQHKQGECTPVSQSEVVQVQVHETDAEISDFNNHVENVTEVPPDGTENPELALFSDGHLEQAVSIGAQSIGDLSTAGTQTVIIVNDKVPEAVAIETQDKSTCTLDAESMEQRILVTTQIPKPVSRRRGRPKKGEEKNKVAIEAVSREQEKPPLPDRGSDGKFHCVRCKRAFTKERFFVTHKCLASSDYVDITKKDVVTIESSDEDDEKDAGAQEDDNDEYTAPLLESRDGSTGESSMDGFDKYQVSTDPDGELNQTEKVTDHIEDIPVFRNEDDKLAFEQSLNVDLSDIDHMFKVHIVEQDINENAAAGGRNLTSALSLYSCTVCDKVFKTLSHMRLHCLIHTDLKPFKCPRCDYASNSKGNLYTHMRKHTGQFYRCSKCDFKTVNKSHLVEHEATHSNVRQQCDLCKKDYNTIKSLINHVRKYHCNSKKGKEYLQKFLIGRQFRGSNVIHQCHVCNRKFKKKIDRDRHLFVHDIKDIPNIKHCQLCDYTASRRIYLEKHYQKHRVIYCCCLCDEKFLSTVRLFDHLSSEHFKGDSAEKCEGAFEDCINSSLYLPEPEDSLPPLDKDLINLPPELSQAECQKVLVTDKGSSSSAVVEEPGNPEAFKMESISGTASEVEELEATTTSLLDSDIEKNSVSDTPITSANPESEAQPMEASETTVPVEEDVVMENQPLNETMDSEETDPNHSQSVAQSEENSEAVEESSSVPLENPDQEEESGNENEDSEAAENSNENTKISEVIERLGYQPLTLKIFHKMRETFGNEECEYCGRLFYSKADYEPHLKTHTGDKPFCCEACGFRAITKDNLKRHIEREHEKMTFNCKDCDFVANNRTQLWNHRIKHLGTAGMECPECKEKFDSMRILRTHILSQHPNMNRAELERLTGFKHKAKGRLGRRSYKCPYCDRIFIRANSELQKHLWIHEGVKPFKCCLCSYACRSKNNLQAHMLRHSSEKPFICSECGKAYKSKTALRWHIRSHKDGKLFKCDKCPYEATQRSHLKRHMETHDIVKRFVCQHCDYSANTLGYMKIHYSRNHKGLQYTACTNTDKPMSGDSRVFKCLSCDYLFGNLSDLKRHLKIRHHVQVQDIAGLEQMQMAEIQVLQYTEDAYAAPVEELEGPSTASVQEIQDSELQRTAVQPQLDEKTASAVNLLQQIIDMSQQGAFGQQQITVQSEDGQMVAVNPDTIIVQQEGEELLVTDSNSGMEGSQYVIQYVSPDTPLEGPPLQIQTTEHTLS